TGALPADATVVASSTPPSVVLTGRSQVLDSIQRVVATAPAIGGGTATPVALDAQGRAVADIAYEPATVVVAVATRDVLVTQVVAIDLTTPVAPNLVSATLTTDSVTLAGPQQTLDALEVVTGTVEPPTGTIDPGRYTLPVRLALPEGVVAMTTPTAALLFAREALPP